MGVDLGNKIAKAFSNINFGDFSGRSESINTTVEMDISHIENPNIELEAINGGIIVENWDEDFISVNINCRYKDGLFREGEDFFEFYKTDNKIIFSPIFTGNLSIDLKVFYQISLWRNSSKEYQWTNKNRGFHDGYFRFEH